MPPSDGAQSSWARAELLSARVACGVGGETESGDPPPASAEGEARLCSRLARPPAAVLNPQDATLRPATSGRETRAPPPPPSSENNTRYMHPWMERRIGQR